MKFSSPSFAALLLSCLSGHVSGSIISSRQVAISRPEDGDYVIYNRVLSPTGDRLALNFNGQGETVTVQPLNKTDNAQIWHIFDYESDGVTQAISPKSSDSLQAAWGSGVVTVLPTGGYVWAIRSTDFGYTIQDGGLTAFWGVTNANVNSSASIGPAQEPSFTQSWILEQQ